MRVPKVVEADRGHPGPTDDPAKIPRREIVGVKRLAVRLAEDKVKVADMAFAKQPLILLLVLLHLAQRLQHRIGEMNGAP